jgi:nucleotide-binding universal stress UspA family protein
VRELRHPHKPQASSGRASKRRAVILTTLGVPFDPEASRLAVDAAVESGRPLVVANVVELPPLGMSVNMRYDQLDDPPELAAALRAPAELARALGVQVERLRVRSLRPVEALLELVEERRPAVLVFGPDRSKLRRRRYRRAARAVRERVTCLVWLPE